MLNKYYDAHSRKLQYGVLCTWLICVGIIVTLILEGDLSPRSIAEVRYIAAGINLANGNGLNRTWRA
jgi:hypothetical protein